MHCTPMQGKKEIKKTMKYAEEKDVDKMKRRKKQCA